MCKIAVSNTGYAIKDIPKKFLDQNLCILAMEENGRALSYIPKKYRTFKVCKSAYESEQCWSIESIPKKFWQKLGIKRNY